MPERINKILVVEGENGTLLSSVTPKLYYDGNRILRVYTGESCMETIKFESPDIVLLARDIPGNPTALQLAREIAESKKSIEPLVVIVSGSPEDSVEEKRQIRVAYALSRRVGADDYIYLAENKKGEGTEIGVILARVRALQRRLNGQLERDKVLVSGDLNVDVVGRKVFRAGEEINLPYSAFELLIYLIKNKGNIVEDAVVLHKVYKGKSSDRNIIKDHIRLLRQAIEEDISKPSRIETIKGVGYRFEG